MKVFKYSMLLLTLLASVSCATKVNRFEPASYLGSKITMPREIDNLSKAPNKIIVLLDLVTCPSCELKSLNFWDDDLILFNELNKEKPCMDIIVVVNTEQNDEISSSLSRLEEFYPVKVLYDRNNEFMNRFTPPIETQYHCFLVDESSRIRLIGYPYMNTDLRDKYVSLIFGE